MSGFTTDLLTGLAAHLAANSIGTFSTSGAYTALQTGIVLGTLPQSPDRAIALRAYPVTDDPALSDSVVGVQVTFRWNGSDPRPVDDLADSVFALWHNLIDTTLSTGVRVGQMRRNSQTSIGQDENQRWAVSANYYVGVHRPSANRT